MDLRERAIASARHPWEIARARFFHRIVADIGAAGPTRVLDIGAGDGWLAEGLLGQLPPGSAVTCCDVNYSEGDLLREVPGVRFLRAVPDETFDLVLLLDVLEHVEDDTQLLASVVERLRPGGHALVSVPAHPRLFTDHDRMLAHVRRYRVRQARELVASALDLQSEGSLFTTLLVPRAVERLVESRRSARVQRGVGGWNGGRLVSALLVGALSADGAVNRAVAKTWLWLPGLSYWAVGRKRSTSG